MGKITGKDKKQKQEVESTIEVGKSWYQKIEDGIRKTSKGSRELKVNQVANKYKMAHRVPIPQGLGLSSMLWGENEDVILMTLMTLIKEILIM